MAAFDRFADAEVVLEVVDKIVGTAQHAGYISAELYVVLAHRLGVVHRIKRDDTEDMIIRQAEQSAHVVHRLCGYPAELFLRDPQHGKERSLRFRVSFLYLFYFANVFFCKHVLLFSILNSGLKIQNSKFSFIRFAHDRIDASDDRYHVRDEIAAGNFRE